MSHVPDIRLDALLRDLPPPPVPAGLATRIVAAAAATPQEARQAHARRNARDRRGKWLRRPLFIGTAALGLVFTSAVAATLAGVPIPQKIAAVFFPETNAPEPKQVMPQHRAPRPAAAPRPVQSAQAEPAKDSPVWSPRPNPLRRLFMAERIIAARRAMGLPTPGADRLERQLRRRAEMWQAATPEQRAAWVQRQQLRQDLRRAMLSTPEGRAELAAQDQQHRWRLLRDWRARRMAGIPLSPEERELRQERRQWREARRERLQSGQQQGGPAMIAGTEGPPGPER